MRASLMWVSIAVPTAAGCCAIRRATRRITIVPSVLSSLAIGWMKVAIVLTIPAIAIVLTIPAFVAIIVAMIVALVTVFLVALARTICIPFGPRGIATRSAIIVVVATIVSEAVMLILSSFSVSEISKGIANRAVEIRPRSVRIIRLDVRDDVIQSVVTVS